MGGLCGLKFSRIAGDRRIGPAERAGDTGSSVARCDFNEM
ncbi:hypothetical protein BSIN_4781 [Burkholderia singularis]|uniref:Uncharacterized protein n=1 Tax=Burkholderia singularis TaxID=1503053 RepID=A0A238H982_9BURK|nr:hypothetical protein BSIN_4781 [Burkholderia singularis]